MKTDIDTCEELLSILRDARSLQDKLVGILGDRKHSFNSERDLTASLDDFTNLITNLQFAVRSSLGKRYD